MGTRQWPARRLPSLLASLPSSLPSSAAAAVATRRRTRCRSSSSSARSEYWAPARSMHELSGLGLGVSVGVGVGVGVESRRPEFTRALALKSRREPKYLPTLG